jgi:hypothetical protein
MKTFPLSLILVAFVVTACASKPKRTPTLPAPTDTPIPPTSTPIPRPPDGTYSTKITKEELITAGMDEFSACENAGTLELTLAGDRWSIIQTAASGCTVLNPTFGGSVKYSADQVTFHDDNPFGCSADYTYKWFLAGPRLRFTSVDDAECVQRVYYMSQHSWSKEK